MMVLWAPASATLSGLSLQITFAKTVLRVVFPTPSSTLSVGPRLALGVDSEGKAAESTFVSSRLRYEVNTASLHLFSTTPSLCLVDSHPSTLSQQFACISSVNS